MLTAYIEGAMRHARYEWLADDALAYCDIPDLPGVWASGATEEEARIELREVLEDWIALGLSLHHPFPTLDSIEIHVAAPT